MAAVINQSVKGPADLYDQMLEVKNGDMVSKGRRGFTHITKKQAKACGIEWSFVEQSCQILGLKLQRHARMGYIIIL